MSTVNLICNYCNIQFIVKYKYRNKRKYCSVNCSVKAHSGSGNPAYGHTYRTKDTHPEWANKISTTLCNNNEHMKGNNNPMCNPNVASRMSKTRREKVTSSPEYRENLSTKMKIAWANGKYQNVATGKCKWFTYIKKDGSICKVQGTWELAYAKWLDEQNIEFHTHKGRITYIDENGSEKSYYPDFFLLKDNQYVDIKNSYHYNLQPDKFTKILNSNPNIKIKLLFKEDLKKLGVLK